jgi:hypothetical protein
MKVTEAARDALSHLEQAVDGLLEIQPDSAICPPTTAPRQPSLPEAQRAAHSGFPRNARRGELELCGVCRRPGTIKPVPSTTQNVEEPVFSCDLSTTHSGLFNVSLREIAPWRGRALCGF